MATNTEGRTMDMATVFSRRDPDKRLGVLQQIDGMWYAWSDVTGAHDGPFPLRHDAECFVWKNSPVVDRIERG